MRCLALVRFIRLYTKRKERVEGGGKVPALESWMNDFEATQSLIPFALGASLRKIFR